jgi:4-aminobutyrate aminotransferase
MFTIEHYGIVPDILVIGKGLGGGIFPMAALLARDRFEVAGDRALGHFTHEKNPVACAAALATIEVIEEEGLLEQARRKGERALRRLREIQRRHPIVRDVRGLGLMLGADLVRPDGSRAIDEAERVMYAALSRGLSFKLTMGNILLLVPPLTISDAELDEAMDVLEECIGEVG